jgi:hypothetical protein
VKIVHYESSKKKRRGREKSRGKKPDQSEDARTGTFDIRNRRSDGSKMGSGNMQKQEKGKSFVEPREMENIDHYS